MNNIQNSKVSVIFQKPYSFHEKAEKITPCYGDGIEEYVKKTSQIQDLYDYLTFKETKLFSKGNAKLIIGKEDDLNYVLPVYRAFNVEKNGKKTLMATLIDYYHGVHTFFNQSGDRIGGKAVTPQDEVPMLFVNDSSMSAQVQDMSELPKVAPTATSKIRKFNSKGQFNGMHTNIVDNFVNLVKGILVGGGDIDADIIKNADKYMKFDDITPQALNISGLIEKNRFQIYQNALEIDNGLIEGTVPLFEDHKIDIREGEAPLLIKMRGDWYNPPKRCIFSDGINIFEYKVEQKPSLLDEQAMTFIKAVSKYLTELNKTVGHNTNYLEVIKRLMIR